MSLARTVDAVRPMQAGVEPLRRVRRRHLHGEHVDELVAEGVRVTLRIEIAALPSPVGPGAGESLEHLLGGMLADQAFLLRQRRKRLGVGGRAPEPGGDGLLLDLFQPCRNAGLAEIFLRQHVGSDLRPGNRHLDVVGTEHHRSVRVANLTDGQPELDARVGGLSFLGIAPLYPHLCLFTVAAATRAGIPPRYKEVAAMFPATRPWPPAAYGLARR